MRDTSDHIEISFSYLFIHISNRRIEEKKQNLIQMTIVGFGIDK